MGAALLFLVQPILARLMLPWFGGAPAVWTTCLLFFQVALVGGYAYTHLLVHRLGRWAVPVHLALLVMALLLLPIAPDPSWHPAPGDAPILRILGLLTVTVGAPYLLLSATAPLLQARAVAVGDPAPFSLYAWSNVGSIGALLAYPFVVEPLVGASEQAGGWGWGLGVFVALMAAVLWPGRRKTGQTDASTDAGAEQVGGVWLWIALSACGTALLMAVTDAVTQDLSVTPLFWVGPLALYLLSFVLAFGRPAWAKRTIWVPAGVVSVLGLVWLLHQGYHASWPVQLGTYWTALFALCVLLHGELWRSRPPATRLTSFYLALSVGGALGGVAVAVLAPLLLPLRLELHLSLVAIWALVGARMLSGLRQRAFQSGLGVARGVIYGLGLLLVMGLGHHGWRRMRGGAELYRSFYGTLQVKSYHPKRDTGDIRHLLDGRISHGFQYLHPTRRHRATAYFAPKTGVGRALSLPGEARRVGVLGLGVGTMAAYGRMGDVFRFYELNPDVAQVAAARFTFLSDSAAKVEVVLGDGRLSLAAEADNRYDLLILDAFSGDAIPAHLLTREAGALYERHLAPGGLLLVNVSNRHADLSRAVRGLAAGINRRWRWVRAHTQSPLGPYRSDWMVLGTDEALSFLDGVASNPPSADRAAITWTDDYAPVLPLLL